MTTTAQDEQHTKVATRAVLVTRITVVAALLLGTLIVGLQLVTTLAIRQEQKVGVVRGESIKATAEQVESCTTPGRACFQRSQEATAAAVGSINEVAVYAAACADKPKRQTVAQIQRCVIEQLAAAQQDTN